MIKLKLKEPKTMLLYLGLLAMFCLSAAGETQAQNSSQARGIKLLGLVVDADGHPLAGATIIESPSGKGTVSDMKGNFAIDVSRNSVLTVSYIGYVTQRVSIGASQLNGTQKITVTLQEDRNLMNEVVVVGYGTQKKVNLTGAVAQVNGESLANRSVSNITQALQGQVGNLNISSDVGGAPGAKQSINLRGYTGFGTAAAPLVVIDGIQGGDLNMINMSDVESISVLKDAASAAIYGSNAPFGVILVTTKKGQKGQKPTITFEHNVGFAEPINLPQMMNSIEVADFFNQASTNSQRAPRVNEEQMGRIRDYMDGLISTETIANPVQGKDGWMPGNANNDWFDLWFKKMSFTQKHNVGVSGSSATSRYYIGLGYFSQDGIFKAGEDSYSRLNARANLSTDITKWLTVAVRSSFARGDTRTIDEDPESQWQGPRMHAIARMPAFDPYIYPNGTKNDRYLGYDQAGKVRNVNDNMLLTGEITFLPLPGWDIVANYSVETDNNSGSYHQKTVYQTTSKGNVVPIYGNPNSFSRSFSKNQHTTINVFSNFEKQIKKHYFKVLVGFAQELYDNVGMNGANSYLYTDNLPSISLTYGPSPSVSDSASQLAIRGGFGRVNYNYDERYLVEFNGRYDATSRFMKDVRYKFYPGVSGAWVPSKENFWKPIAPYVNLFKIRASYGQLGDQNVGGYYPFYPSMVATQAKNTNYIFSDGLSATVRQPSMIDPSLSWVTSSTLDFGFDATFLSNRLDLSFDWYRRRVDDVVGPAQMKPAILGTDPPQTNSASMKTEGFELSIGWKDRIGAVNYSVNAVLSDYESTILKYPTSERLTYVWYPGMSIGEIWGYRTVGLFQSQDEINSSADQTLLYNKWRPGDCRYADLDGDEKITWGDNTVDNPGDKRIIGNTTPRYSYGISINVEYKGIDLSIFMQGVGKRNSVIDPDNNTATYFWGITGDESQSNGFKDQLDRWSTTNPSGYYPNFYWGSEMVKNKHYQTRYMQDASYLRMKNLQVGYSFPKKLLSRVKIQNLRVFASVENLFTITKMIKTMDPEFSNTQGYFRGTDGKVYPLQRIWSMGLNLTF